MKVQLSGRVAGSDKLSGNVDHEYQALSPVYREQIAVPVTEHAVCRNGITCIERGYAELLEYLGCAANLSHRLSSGSVVSVSHVTPQDT